jgi:hypothetical protein
LVAIATGRCWLFVSDQRTVCATDWDNNILINVLGEIGLLVVQATLIGDESGL